MILPYYRLLAAFAASVSLLLAGCGGGHDDAAAPAAAQPGAAPPGAAKAPDEIDTESTIWTMLGLAKKPSQVAQGPHTGPQVSPVLWQAAHDALDFVKITSEDPETGVLETDWYSPPGKPNERMRVAVFILARALRSTSVAVTIDRQERSGTTGPWQPSSVTRETVADLETAILLRARQIHAERYRGMM
jgi:hypothetical protein